MTNRKAIGIGVKGVVSKGERQRVKSICATDRRVVPTGEIIY